VTIWLKMRRQSVVVTLAACVLFAAGCDVGSVAHDLQGSQAASTESGRDDGEAGDEADDSAATSDGRLAEGSDDDATTATADQSGIGASTSYGPRQSYDPTYDVAVPVGKFSQSLIDTHPPGTRFRIAAGTHRLPHSLEPKKYQQFLGAPGSIVSGAKVLTDWRSAGPHWYVSGQTQRLPTTPVGGSIGSCKPEYPRCFRGEDVFLDGRLLRHVGSLDQVGPGRYFFDYERDRIYIGDDPSGHVIETSVAAQALVSNASGVVVQNLVIEMFGGHGQSAAVHGGGSPGWSLIDCEVRFNHGAGAKVSSGVVAGSYVHHNGKFGLAGSGEGNRVIGNEIAYNNTAGYDRGAGGAKWVLNDGLVVKNNWSHHNDGPGLWTDISNIDTVYEDNLITDNAKAGIMHEISYRAIIRNNTIRRNGHRLGSAWWVGGAGVYVVNSPDVEVYSNTIVGNGAGVMGRHGESRTNTRLNTNGATALRNFHVHDNTITMSAGRTGIVSDSADTFLEDRNRFVANNYSVDDVDGRYWEWRRVSGDASGRTWTEWIKFGNDRDGSLSGG
jgi:parallel beta-helix repeat protein